MTLKQRMNARVARAKREIDDDGTPERAYALLLEVEQDMDDYHRGTWKGKARRRKFLHPEDE